MVDKVTDAEYLKSRGLGSVIAKGMAAMYEEEPKNPVDFLAKWLLNYSQVERTAEQRQEELVEVESHIQMYAETLAKTHHTNVEEQKKKRAVEDEKEQFKSNIAKSEDLTDNLQDLTDHVKKFTNASAVYLGKLVTPK